MASLREQITTIVAEAFAACGFDGKYGKVAVSDRPDMGQFQCNGTLVAAKAHTTSPHQVAERVVEALAVPEIFREVSVAGPGFINLTLTDTFLAEQVQGMAADPRHACEKTAAPLKIIVDYGGPNVAKAHTRWPLARRHHR